MQSQVRFNRVAEKVPEEAPGSPGSDQTFTGTFSGTLLNLTWLCTKASQVLRNPVEPDLALKPPHGNPAEVFPALGFAACFRKTYKNKTLQLLGIPPKLIFLPNFLSLVVFDDPMPFFIFFFGKRFLAPPCRCW